MTPELIVLEAPKSKVSESFRTLRSNLQFTSLKSNKSFLVTSSVSGEGKSYVTANLAIAYAQNNKKTLIVDCDMRRGRQHGIFKLASEKGLSNLLISDVQKEYKNYIQNTNIKNLDVITRGIVPPNPSELLDSNNLRDLINILEKDYDIILFDGTPINGLSDSIILASFINRVIIVATLNYTSESLLISTKKTLESINCNIAGVVANKVKNNDRYSKNYYDYYTF